MRTQFKPFEMELGFFRSEAYYFRRFFRIGNMKSVSDQVLARIRRKGRKYAFSGKDFLDLATRTAVEKEREK